MQRFCSFVMWCDVPSCISNTRVPLYCFWFFFYIIFSFNFEFFLFFFCCFLWWFVTTIRSNIFLFRMLIVVVLVRLNVCYNNCVIYTAFNNKGKLPIHAHTTHKCNIVWQSLIVKYANKSLQMCIIINFTNTRIYSGRIKVFKCIRVSAFYWCKHSGGFTPINMHA